ncbi:MAG: protein phosphatase 2C domain-containing protein [Myxococcota bacterium]|nr:protein phosphatase 2C domain-containing protein [Myxococcota bacterium]MDW8360867.1 protein phosphatase 2C domain-containing protein [Myxococcales bacterium]
MSADAHPPDEARPALPDAPPSPAGLPNVVVPEGEPEAVDKPMSGEVHLDVELDTALDAGEDEPSGPVARILVTAFGSTDPGRRRQHNEDAMASIANEVFVIADGMGGYAAGEVASQMAIDVMTAAFETQHFGTLEPSLPRRGAELVGAIKLANRAIHEQARSNEAQAGMGTTVVAARFSRGRQRVYIAHVGDSRCYRLRDGIMTQLTTDHTLASLGITGPASHRLVRALGVHPEVDVDLRIDTALDGDVYLLCSDGLSKMVPERVIADVVQNAADLQAAVTELIRRANDAGGRDNVSVILVRVDDVATGQRGSTGSDPGPFPTRAG